MKKLLALIFCPTCHHVFGSHDPMIHVLEIERYVDRIQRETPWMWKVRINIPALQKELDRWKKYI